MFPSNPALATHYFLCLFPIVNTYVHGLMEHVTLWVLFYFYILRFMCVFLLHVCVPCVCVCVYLVLKEVKEVSYLLYLELQMDVNHCVNSANQMWALSKSKYSQPLEPSLQPHLLLLLLLMYDTCVGAGERWQSPRAEVKVVMSHLTWVLRTEMGCAFNCSSISPASMWPLVTDFLLSVSRAHPQR